MLIELTDSIFVAGHGGLVGSAVVRRLEQEGFANILTASRGELDLRRQSDVERWFAEHRPKYVFLVAGTVGGVFANSTRQAEFLYDNLLIHANVIEAARRFDTAKLLYLGSACVYPRLSEQPIAESALLTAPLEPTNEGYALAKISGMRLCDYYRDQYGCNFISAMPTNLYGPKDNFDLESSHVIPALLRKFHEAKMASRPSVEIWGSGRPTREFMYVDDLADCCLFLMDRFDEAGHINVGTGIDISIGDLAKLISEVVYPGVNLRFDSTKPDGMPRRVLDVSKLTERGWRATTDLKVGLEATYEWFCEQRAEADRAVLA